MAAELAEIYKSVRREYARRADAPRLPHLDPNADDYLEQLFAWCDAYISECGISQEALDHARARAKSIMAERRRLGEDP